MKLGSSRRRDTGRTDKYSDETPSKDYKDYRKDYPKENETARNKAEDISKTKKEKFIGDKSFESRKQELISHIQNYKETFSNAEHKIWLAKFDVLKRVVNV